MEFTWALQLTGQVLRHQWQVGLTILALVWLQSLRHFTRLSSSAMARQMSPSNVPPGKLLVMFDVA